MGFDAAVPTPRLRSSMNELPFADDLAEMLIDAAPDAMMLVDADGVIRLANDAAADIFDRTESDLVGSSVDQLVPDEHRAGHAALRDQYVSDPTRRPMGTGLRLSGRRSDGALFPVEISLSPISVNGVQMTIAAVRDVTDRRETMARLALLKDRERIARDIHDLVIQRIFAAGMSIQAVSGLVDAPAVRERLAEVTDNLDETIRQLRQSIFELGRFDEHQSLSSQLASIVDERAQHLGFAPELRIDGRLDDVPEFVADQVVATLTEALSNVARHAGATSARVEVVCSDGNVSLTVEDNGTGINREPKAKGGLSNMMWRAAELGGSCSVLPNEPEGTRLVWRVPLSASGSTA